MNTYVFMFSLFVPTISSTVTNETKTVLRSEHPSEKYAVMCFIALIALYLIYSIGQILGGYIVFSMNGRFKIDRSVFYE